jgi:hypothetical protein
VRRRSKYLDAVTRIATNKGDFRSFREGLMSPITVSVTQIRLHTDARYPAIPFVRAALWCGQDGTGGSTVSFPGKYAISTDLGARYEAWTTWFGATSTGLETFPAWGRRRYGYETSN